MICKYVPVFLFVKQTMTIMLLLIQTMIGNTVWIGELRDQ